LSNRSELRNDDISHTEQKEGPEGLVRRSELVEPRFLVESSYAVQRYPVEHVRADVLTWGGFYGYYKYRL